MKTNHHVSAFLLPDLVAVAGVSRNHVIAVEEKLATIIVVDKTETLHVVEKLDRCLNVLTPNRLR